MVLICTYTEIAPIPHLFAMAFLFFYHQNLIYLYFDKTIYPVKGTILIQKKQKMENFELDNSNSTAISMESNTSWGRVNTRGPSLSILDLHIILI